MTMLKHLNVTPGDGHRTLPNGHLPTMLNSSRISSLQSGSGSPGEGAGALTDVTRNTSISHVSGVASPGSPPHEQVRPSTSSGATPAARRAPAARSLIPLLALLCVVSLLMSILALLFFVEVGSQSGRDAVPPADGSTKVVSADEFRDVTNVTLGLVAITLSLDLCCLLLCSVQFVFAVRLLGLPGADVRISEYLKNSSCGRLLAVAAFFVSIPLFLTGVILYTFLHLDSTPAIVISALIGCGIVFCGCAMVHNVYLWQKEKLAVLPGTEHPHSSCNGKRSIRTVSGDLQMGLPSPTLDLSTIAPQSHLELSTLV